MIELLPIKSFCFWTPSLPASYYPSLSISLFAPLSGEMANRVIQRRRLGLLFSVYSYAGPSCTLCISPESWRETWSLGAKRGTISSRIPSTRKDNIFFLVKQVSKGKKLKFSSHICSILLIFEIFFIFFYFFNFFNSQPVQSWEISLSKVFNVKDSWLEELLS